MSGTATIEPETITLKAEAAPSCGVCSRPGPELVEIAPDTDLYASRCVQHLEEPPNHRRENFWTANGGRPFKLTKEERHQAFAGALKQLKRADKPDQEAKAKIIVSWTKGGRQIVDYGTGETIYIPRQPRLWVVVKGWHLKAGSTEWETAVEIIDLREQNRVLANGVGGLPRESGLKTRWGESVAADGSVSDRDVPRKEEQHENWTAETERGYGGRNELERCDFNGNRVPSAGVDDETLAKFSKRAEQDNLAKQMKHRQAAKAAQREARAAVGRMRRLVVAAHSRPLDVADIAAPLDSSAENV